MPDRPFKILLVEDNPADVFLIEEALRTHDVTFDLTWFNDGEQAIEMLQSTDHSAVPDMVLLDLNLPKVDGKEVLAQIRGMSSFENTPVAILTSSDSPRDREETKRLGASCYIKKPPTLDEFLAVGGIIKSMLS